MLRNGCLPHALLFIGNDGIGKQQAARMLAMACNCQKDSKPQTTTAKPETCKLASFSENPCGTCRSCRKMKHDQHPDLLVIRPSNNVIKIAQIRSLLQRLTQKPHEACMRVVLIVDAHYMNPEAANALLKVLEEPPAHTLLILTARQITDLLPTIVSRCRPLRFQPVSRHHLQAVLMEKRGLDTNTAAVIATMANGSLERALKMSDTTASSEDHTVSWLAQRQWLITELMDILSAPSYSAFLSSRLLTIAEKLSADKERLPEVFDMLRVLLRDLIVSRYDTAKIINRDLTETIQHVSKKHSVASLLSKMKTLEKAQKAIQSNAIVRLSLEIMMMRLARM
jgi:DNA polymerase-3 subunit delta'